MADKFEVLNDREHTLRKAHIMVGGLVEEDFSTYINGEYKTLQVVPGLLVITREIIDNCVDEFIRSGGKYSNKIIIDMTPLSLTVEDNGRGIPVERYVNKENNIDEWRPVLCWTQLRAGTSFYNHNIGPSSNGVGASVANILSTYFVGETWDGKKHCKVICSDNMGNIDVHIENDTNHKTGTRVVIEPDFNRFGVSCYSIDHILATKERIIALSSVYPEITFIFNGEKIRTKKPKEYLSVYNKKYELYESKDYFFAIMPTELDEYYQQCYIDGLYIKNGGTHEIYISKELSYALREIIKKKYKLEMSPAEIKRGFFLLFNARYFPQMKFDSQTKERLTNSEAEVKSYLGDVDFEKIAKNIVNIPEIIEPIIEAKLAKQIAAEKRAVTMAQKKMAKKYVEKHIPAKSKNPDEKILYVSEGDCLHEDTYIKCVNEYGNVVDKKIKEVHVGDTVITHNHRLRKVVGKTNKVKTGYKIKIGDDFIIASENHRFYVYDTDIDEFKFLKVCEIDKNKHKIVKSNFFDICSGFAKVTKINEINGEYDYEFLLENVGHIIKTTKDHIFVKFNINDDGIIKEVASNIHVGDYLAISKV